MRQARCMLETCPPNAGAGHSWDLRERVGIGPGKVRPVVYDIPLFVDRLFLATALAQLAHAGLPGIRAVLQEPRIQTIAVPGPLSLPRGKSSLRRESRAYGPGSAGCACDRPACIDRSRQEDHDALQPWTEHGGHALLAGLCASHMASMSTSRTASRILVRALSEYWRCRVEPNWRS